MNRQNQPAQPDNNEQPEQAPITIEEFSPALIEAMKQFRDSKPWRGAIEERTVKFQTLHSALRGVVFHNRPAFNNDGREFAKWDLRVEHIAPGEVMPSKCPWDLEGDSPALVLLHKLSVVTYLFGVGVILFRNDRVALTWAKALYREIFPRSAARMVEAADGRIVRPTTNSN